MSEDCEEIEKEITNKINWIVEQAEHIGIMKQTMEKIKMDTRLTEEQKQHWIDAYQVNIEERKGNIEGNKRLIQDQLHHLRRCALKKK